MFGLIKFDVRHNSKDVRAGEGAESERDQTAIAGHIGGGKPEAELFRCVERVSVEVTTYALSVRSGGWGPADQTPRSRRGCFALSHANENVAPILAFRYAQTRKAEQQAHKRKEPPEVPAARRSALWHVSLTCPNTARISERNLYDRLPPRDL